MSTLTINKEKEKKQEHSNLEIASYGSGKFLVEFLQAAFSALVYKYYETNLQLDPILTAVGIICFSIWNAINDPLVGYFTIRPTPFAKKYGRRLPWIVFGCFIWVFSILLIFIVPSSIASDPENNQFWILAWMIFATCTFDTFFSIWELNYQSLFPDKFRGEKIRAKAAGIATIIGVFGIAIGSILPGFILGDYTDNNLYITNAWIFVIVGLIFFFLIIPGCIEDKEMIDRYLISIEKQKESGKKEDSFFVQFKDAFKEKNFMAFILLYFFYQSATMSMTASVHYIGDYILLGGSSTTTIIFAGFLIGALISVPFWMKIASLVHSNQKTLIYSSTFMACALLPMTFMNNSLGFTITVGLFGFGFGGFWLLITPSMADVIDEIVIKTGKRNDGIYMGFRAFWGRLAFALQAISFGVVHELTGFVNKPGVDQSSEAIWGIHLHMSFIPMIFLIIGIIIFWKMNELTPEKVKNNKIKLLEMGL